MRILVTGSDGCLGGAIADHLRSAGHTVQGTVFFRPPRADEFRLDLTDPGALAGLPPGPFDAIIHTAGIVDQDAPARLIKAVNELGTRRLVAWAARQGCGHFIFTGSISVYGVLSMGEHRTEKTPALRPLALLPYMRSKLMAEKHIRASGLPHTILRLPAMIGCGDAFLSPTIVGALLSGRMFFSGRRERLVSLMSVANLCRVMAQLVARGPLGGAFNCADHHLPWRTLVTRYAAELGIGFRDKRKSILTLVGRLADKHYLLLLTFSFFGAHYPDGTLHRLFPHTHAQSWQEAVRAAVKAVRAQHSRTPPPPFDPPG